MVMTGMKRVIGVKSLGGSKTRHKFWTEDKPLPGDILERLSGGAFKRPYNGGKSRLQKELGKLFCSSKEVEICVTRGNVEVEVSVTVVQDLASAHEKQYLIAAYNDPAHIVTLTDGTEEEFCELQGKSRKLLDASIKKRDIAEHQELVRQLSNSKLQDAYMPSYPWRQKMNCVLRAPGAQSVFTLLLLPYQPYVGAREYSDLEDTSTRAVAWLSSAQASGIPLVFSHIQTETVFLKVFRQDREFFREDISNVANKDNFMLRGSDSAETELLRAVRLWYLSTETFIDIKANTGESVIGVGISRTEEGFCYISSVKPNTAADRAGLRALQRQAESDGKLLVLSRVGQERVTPWLVSTSGSIRCFDTISISRRFALHRQLGHPIRLHFIMCASPHGISGSVDSRLLTFEACLKRPFLLGRAPYSSDSSHPTDLELFNERHVTNHHDLSISSSSEESQSSPTRGGQDVVFQPFLEHVAQKFPSIALAKSVSKTSEISSYIQSDASNERQPLAVHKDLSLPSHQLSRTKSEGPLKRQSSIAETFDENSIGHVGNF